MITVMGATGNTGSKIASALLRRGEQVRALGRSQRRLQALAGAGADVRVGDAADAAFLTEAFQGADAVYTLLPTDQRAPDYRARQMQEGEAIAEAIRASGVPYVVALSSIGADMNEGTGVILGLHAQEQRLRRIPDVNLLLLRPVSFFENFLESLETIRHHGVLADCVEAELAIPMVGTRDIAAAATEALARRDWQGEVVRELLGPRDLSYSEAARILGAHIGKPDLAYMQMPPDEMEGAMVEAGLSSSFARLYIEMVQSFSRGTVRPMNGRTPQNTTAFRFEDYAAELGRIYLAA
ncbi:MAG: NmrA family NAD(P)-binding protein [Ectothiorhodospiraceae bacterium]|nr:NmrA family NAD(P)-binding protein [Ectothiorhodospiraceae bacterium]MCH8504033.1 NAD(P)H-binding protein [Ectothiorhodospiraceae bacterium]